MKEFKAYILSFLFILGLFISPNVSFEERVDIALKFESGLSIKREVTEGIFNNIISIAKNDSKKNREFILSEHRNATLKLDNSSSDADNYSIANSVLVRKYAYYLNSISSKYSALKSIYQLRSLRI